MSAVMRLKTLEGHLQELRVFERPKIKLEQYVTPPHIAAHILYSMQIQFEDIEGKNVLDAGCGPGNFSIGAALLEADIVTSLDIDDDALKIFHQNVEDFEISNIDAVQCDFLKADALRWNNYFDTVIMNPPFGTKHNAGIDMKFLRMGLQLSSNSVYSLHKSSTRSHIQKKIKEWGVQGSVVAELCYNLEATFAFHKKQSKDIEVDLWRLNHVET